MSNSDYSHYQELTRSNYEVATGEPDIRKWVLKNDKGNIFGEVAELIFDRQSQKVVFIVLNTDKNELNLKERKVLLPIAYADIHAAYKNVVYPSLTPNEISALPDYEKGKFSRNALDLTHSTFIRSSGEVPPIPEQVAAKHYSARTFSEHVRSGTLVSSTASDRKPLEHAERAFTVVGVFEKPEQAQEVIDRLLSEGYNRSDITVTARQTQLNHEQHYRDREGISDYFNSLFTRDDDVRRYADAAENHYILSADVPSSDHAEEVAHIFDQHGSIKMNADALGDESTMHTRVFRREL